MGTSIYISDEAYSAQTPKCYVHPQTSRNIRLSLGFFNYGVKGLVREGKEITKLHNYLKVGVGCLNYKMKTHPQNEAQHIKNILRSSYELN